MRALYTMLVLMMITVIAAAQNPEMMGGRQKMMDRVEHFKKIRMLEAMKLDEETGLKLVSRYTKHRENVKQLEEARTGVVEHLESQLRSGASDVELQKQFNDFYEADRKITDARKKYLEDLKEILTAKQIAQYIVFEKNFMSEVRDLVRDVQKERRKRED